MCNIYWKLRYINPHHAFLSILMEHGTFPLSHIVQWSDQFCCCTCMTWFKPTFPESVKPVKIKLISSPLLHLSVVPSMFNSTLFGSATQHTIHLMTKLLVLWSRYDNNMLIIILTEFMCSAMYIPKLQPTGGSILSTNVPWKKYNAKKNHSITAEWTVAFCLSASHCSRTPEEPDFILPSLPAKFVFFA